ncbi:hypothetical protein [Staphylococcus saccharolyticus]
MENTYDATREEINEAQRLLNNE